MRSSDKQLLAISQHIEQSNNNNFLQLNLNIFLKLNWYIPGANELNEWKSLFRHLCQSRHSDQYIKHCCDKYSTLYEKGMEHGVFQSWSPETVDRHRRHRHQSQHHLTMSMYIYMLSLLICCHDAWRHDMKHVFFLLALFRGNHRSLDFNINCPNHQFGYLWKNHWL